MRALAVLLVLGACAADETVSGYAGIGSSWALSPEAGFGDRVTLSLPEPGRVAGQAPCNRYNAAQTAPYPWFELGPIASTRMACPELQKEAAFFAALGSMTISEVSGDVLILSNEAGESLTFQRSATK